MSAELAVFQTRKDDWHNGALKTGGDRGVMVARLKRVIVVEAEKARERTEKAAVEDAARPGRGKRQKRPQGHRYAE